MHTNLGRAPLAPSAMAPLVDAATGYVALEYDLERGRRGARDTHLEGLLSQLTGAEAAVVVNNNAAATLLLLSALAAGREVIVSRGELVEIGGGFRVPEVMAQSGAMLREVGTTNKTRAADYAAAISERTRCCFASTRRIFASKDSPRRPALAELVALGRRFGVVVAEDLGSGYLASAPSDTPQRLDEPPVQASVATGADVVCFSGDKLLGGPQAGILVGRRDWIQRIRTHPPCERCAWTSSPTPRLGRPCARTPPDAHRTFRSSACSTSTPRASGDGRGRSPTRFSLQRSARKSWTACPPSAVAARLARTSRQSCWR